MSIDRSNFYLNFFYNQVKNRGYLPKKRKSGDSSANDAHTLYFFHVKAGRAVWRQENIPFFSNDVLIKRKGILHEAFGKRGNMDPGETHELCAFMPCAGKISADPRLSLAEKGILRVCCLTRRNWQRRKSGRNRASQAEDSEQLAAGATAPCIRKSGCIAEDPARKHVKAFEKRKRPAGLPAKPETALRRKAAGRCFVCVRAAPVKGK